jgi:hypothetical protein
MQAEPKHAIDLRPPRQWRTRGVLVLGLIVLHVTFFYGLAQNRVPVTNSNGPPMFGPVVSDAWRDLRQRPITSKEWTSEPTGGLTPPSRHWLAICATSMEDRITGYMGAGRSAISLLRIMLVRREMGRGGGSVVRGPIRVRRCAPGSSGSILGSDSRTS